MGLDTEVVFYVECDDLQRVERDRRLVAAHPASGRFSPCHAVGQYAPTACPIRGGSAPPFPVFYFASMRAFFYLLLLNSPKPTIHAFYIRGFASTYAHLVRDGRGLPDHKEGAQVHQEGQQTGQQHHTRPEQ